MSRYDRSRNRKGSSQGLGRMAAFLASIGMMRNAVDKKAGLGKFAKLRQYSHYVPGQNTDNVLANKGVRPRRRRSARTRVAKAIARAAEQCENNVDMA